MIIAESVTNLYHSKDFKLTVMYISLSEDQPISFKGVYAMAIIL